MTSFAQSSVPAESTNSGTLAATLDWVPALEHLDAVAAPVAQALLAWAETEPRVATEVLVASIDPELADTQALTDAYALDPAVSANCVLVGGRRAGEERAAAVVVRATTRADVNNAVKRLLDVRKASFLPTEQAVTDSEMEYGGITPLGLPPRYRILLDSRVATGDALIGSGLRSSKILLPGDLLATWPRAEVIEALAL